MIGRSCMAEAEAVAELQSRRPRTRRRNRIPRPAGGAAGGDRRRYDTPGRDQRRSRRRSTRGHLVIGVVLRRSVARPTLKCAVVAGAVSAESDWRMSKNAWSPGRRMRSVEVVRVRAAAFARDRVDRPRRRRSPARRASRWPARRCRSRRTPGLRTSAIMLVGAVDHGAGRLVEQHDLVEAT